MKFETFGHVVSWVESMLDDQVEDFDVLGIARAFADLDGEVYSASDDLEDFWAIVPAFDKTRIDWTNPILA